MFYAEASVGNGKLIASPGARIDVICFWQRNEIFSEL
jgi:hypothetical protein